jgi:MFS family permease
MRVASATAAVPRVAGRNIGFAAATASLVAVFAASGSPIPLYERYRTSDHLTTFDLSIATVSYFLAVMFALLVCGRLSNHLGRRPIGLAAVALAAAGCLSLLDMDSLGVLIAGRILHGLACGLGSSALATYIVDLAPPRPHWLASTAPAAAPLVGLTIGALGSGALAEHGPAPEQSAYLTISVALILCAVLLLLGPEPVHPRPGAWSSLRPRVAIPVAARPLLPAATAVFCATWALGGFYQAFSPTIAAQNLGTRDTLVAGAVFASFMLPYAFGGPLVQRLSTRDAQRAGIFVFAVAAGGVVIGLHVGTIAAVIVCGIVAGAAQGAAFTGSLRGLLDRTAPMERAGLMSTVYLISYGGAAAPSLVAGRLSSVLPLDQIALGYAGLSLIAVLVVFMSTRSVSYDKGSASQDS